MAHIDKTYSFPISSITKGASDDLLVSGIATDGTLDADGQIVDPQWSAKALSVWLATGGNVRESHNPRRPVGKGMSVRTDSNGATWLTSNIVDPHSQKLVRKGVLTAYSVGISNPVIRKSHLAPNGVICGGEFAEVSIVDRPSNPRCGITIAKSRKGKAKLIQKAFQRPQTDEEAFWASLLYDANPYTRETARKALESV